MVGFAFNVCGHGMSPVGDKPSNVEDVIKNYTDMDKPYIFNLIEFKNLSKLPEETQKMFINNLLELETKLDSIKNNGIGANSVRVQLFKKQTEKDKLYEEKKKIEKVVEKIRFAVLLCIRRFQTSEKVNSVLCCTALGKQRHDWVPRACQDARKHIAWLQSDARQSAGKGCLSGICRGRETHSYNDRSCRGGNTSTALVCRYGMTLDLLFESVNGNIIIRMRNRP